MGSPISFFNLPVSVARVSEEKGCEVKNLETGKWENANHLSRTIHSDGRRLDNASAAQQAFNQHQRSFRQFMQRRSFTATVRPMLALLRRLPK